MRHEMSDVVMRLEMSDMWWVTWDRDMRWVTWDRDMRWMTWDEWRNDETWDEWHNDETLDEWRSDETWDEWRSEETWDEWHVMSDMWLTDSDPKISMNFLFWTLCYTLCLTLFLSLEARLRVVMMRHEMSDMRWVICDEFHVIYGLWPYTFSEFSFLNLVVNLLLNPFLISWGQAEWRYDET